MRFGYLFFMASVLVSVVGCSSTPVVDREPSAIQIGKSSILIVGGIRLNQTNGFRGDSALTILRAHKSAQPIRARCVTNNEHTNGIALQIDYGHDTESKTLDLNKADYAYEIQDSMASCQQLLNKLFATTEFYPAYLNFSDDHKIKVSF